MTALVALLVANVFIGAEEAKALSKAQFVDARPAREYAKGHVPGAVRLDWKSYRDGALRVGRLPADDQETADRLGRAGISTGTPVVVVGRAAAGWGEEGRVAWMLAYLGHPQVHILDGGWPAWVQANGAVSTEAATPAAQEFVLAVNPDVRVTHAQFRRDYASLTVLDVRTPEEFAGSAPYLSSRGGHVPGASNVPWRSLFDEHGELDRSDSVRDTLERAGVDDTKPVILYCTGGVRSAQATMALRAMGYDARNYDGGWWEWSADKTAPAEEPRTGWLTILLWIVVAVVAASGLLFALKKWVG